MMAARVKLFMLFVFAYWASGMGQYLHERIEHCPGSGACQAAPARIAISGVSSVHAESHSHSEEDCPICSMLAHMAVGGSAPPPLIYLTNGCHSALVFHDRPAPLSSDECFLPSRGPPSLA